MYNKTKILNLRPLIFLCGPFFDEKDMNDRRNILRKYISSKKINVDNGKYTIEPFSIIVDNLFNDEEKFDNYNVTLIEEIISACAFKNYIFVDTLSTALELGLFSNSYSHNKVTAMLPKDYEYFKPFVGYFITETIEKSSNINLCKYTNKRTNKFIKDEKKYIENIISFKGKKIPKEIKREIQETFSNNIQDYTFTISFSDTNEDETAINYIVKGDKIIFYIPAYILFYLVYKYDNDKEKIKHYILYEFGMYAHYEKKNFCIDYFLCWTGTKEVVIESPFKSRIDDVLDNMNYLITKIKNPQNNSPKRYKVLKYKIIEREYDFISRNLIGINDLFGFDDKQCILNDELLKNRKKWTLNKRIVVNGKKRNITMYAPNSEAYLLRKAHEKIIVTLEKLVILNPNCYAYRKKYSVKKCVNRHKYSCYFLKVDIKNFFNSISKSKMKQILKCYFFENPLDAYISIVKEKKKKYYKSYLNTWDELNVVLDLCFYNNKLPLGFTVSPILSNLYMNFFDIIINKKFPDLVYTRYSDDILISSKQEFDWIKLKEFIAKELSFINLTLNNKKVHNYKLVHEGDHIKFLGINIVKKDEYMNEITVGKKYIKEVCKNVSSFERDCHGSLTFEEVMGQLQYIKSVSTKDYEIFKEIYYIKNNKNFSLDRLKKMSEL